METPLLDRLILVELPPSVIGGASMGVKITCAPNLRVFGYLEPRAHKLQIGDDVIEVRLPLHLYLNMIFFKWSKGVAYVHKSCQGVQEDR